MLKTYLDHCQSIWDIDLYYLPSTAYLCFCLEDIEWTRVHSDFTFLCFGYLPFHISFKHHTLDDTRLVNSWPLKIKRKIYFCWCLYTNKMHISSRIKTAKSFWEMVKLTRIFETLTLSTLNANFFVRTDTEIVNYASLASFLNIFWLAPVIPWIHEAICNT